MLLFGWTIVVVLALLLLLQQKNLESFALRASDEEPAHWPSVSILVPARDEERNIRRCVSSLSALRYPGSVEILVLDDHSSDDTAAMVNQLAALDHRIRLIRGEPLPASWRGKNWACHQLATQARGELLLFTDADTEHAPESLRRTVLELHERGAALLSVMPRQETVTFAEQALLPLLNFFFVTFFPAFMLSRSVDARFHAANGQYLLFRHDAYDAIGGHESVSSSIVDDLALARRIREERLTLSIVDGSALVRCRMYRSVGEVMNGFTKNLFAAVGASVPRAIGIGLLLTMLFVAPAVLFLALREFPFGLATLLGLWLRLRSDVRTSTATAAALLHPVAIATAVVLLIRSTTRALARRPVPWKGRI